LRIFQKKQPFSRKNIFRKNLILGVGGKKGQILKNFDWKCDVGACGRESVRKVGEEGVVGAGNERRAKLWMSDFFFKLE